MFVIPFQVNATEYSIFVALQDDSLARMKEYDPAEVNLNKLGFEKLKLKDVIIGYATDADFQECMKLANGGDVRILLRRLSRGFLFRPEAGDYDGPPLSLKAGTEKPH